MADFEKHKKELNKDGFTIVSTPFLNKELDLIRKEFYKVNSIAYKKLSGNAVSSDQDIILFHKNYSEQQFNVWKVFQFSPLLYAFTGNLDLLELLSKVGVTTPTLDLPPQLRCDMPIENQSIFLKHQDYSYNLGSDDSITIWIPLQDTSKEQGCLLVEPGSHKKGIYNHKNGIISNEIEFKFISQQVLFGQALIFDQKLVHQSGFNSSDKIRFSLQIRYSNLDSNDYLNREWYKNHKTVLQKYA